MVEEFSRRRTTTVQGLNKIPGVSCRMPTGAFYAFPNIKGVLGKRGPSGILKTPNDVASYLLHDAQIAVVPGEPFGSSEHLRLSYATNMTNITRGLERLKQAFAKLE